MPNSNLDGCDSGKFLIGHVYYVLSPLQIGDQLVPVIEMYRYAGCGPFECARGRCTAPTMVYQFSPYHEGWSEEWRPTGRVALCFENLESAESRMLTWRELIAAGSNLLSKPLLTGEVKPG
jgi:hypothetical protein